MGSDYYQFKNFTIRQDACAMKVGTDGVLLGAWAQSRGRHILDVGTGTGICALMMAQKYPGSEITAIDIFEDTIRQAAENSKTATFPADINFKLCRLQDFCYVIPFDAIICNPPFFIDSLRCENNKRNSARHAESLTYKELTRISYQLLGLQGNLSVIIPYETLDLFLSDAIISGFFQRRITFVKTKSEQSPKRVLLELVKTPCHPLISHIIIGDDEHKKLTKEFMLPLKSRTSNREE